MRCSSSFPWGAHCALAALLPLLLAVPPCIEHGVAGDGHPGGGLFLSTGLIVAAWVVAVPLVFAEKSAVERGRPGWTLISAALAHAAMAFVATLPFTLAWMLSGFGSSPVDLEWVRVSAATYAVLLSGYFMVLVAMDRRHMAQR